MTIRHVASLLFALALLSGQVRDRTTGQPLPDVTITVGSSHATTDRDGKYSLKGVTPGKRELKVESSDVPEQRFPLTVKAPSTRYDLRVCSTTLDYNCSAPASSPGNG